MGFWDPPVRFESFGFTIRDFYLAGFTALQLRTAGIDTINNPILISITPRNLYNAGYTIIDLYAAGFTADRKSTRLNSSH